MVVEVIGDKTRALAFWFPDSRNKYGSEGPVLLVCSWPRIRLWSAAVIVVMLSSGASAANGLGGVDGVFVEWTWEGLERGRLWFQPPC